MRCIAIILACLVPLSAHPQERSAQDNFVLGNFEFVLLHELAHVVVGDNDVPILGPLESAADYTAIIMAIRGDGTETAKSFLTQALRDTATSFATTWRLAEANDVPIPYWDVHALSIQRYYAALCLIYGSNPDANRGLLGDLPEGRAAGCVAEYEMANTGFQWLLDTYGASGDFELNSSLVKFNYGRVVSIRQRQLREEIRELGLLENTVNAVLGLFPPKAPILVTMRVCGQPEAAWQPAKRELVICYEMLDAFSRIHEMRSQGK